MTTAELTVIAPCFNEEPNVAPLCARMLAVFDGMPVPTELLLIDDGSHDHTWDRIAAAAQRHERVRGVRHEKNQGIVGGWLSGLCHSSAPLVCLIDSDLQNRPEDIPLLYRTFVEKGPDLVQAVRHPKVNRNRIAFSKGLNALLNLTFGMHLRDNKSGFILCRRAVLEDILEDAAGYRYFQSFIGVAAGVRGLHIEEVDNDFDGRNAGQSFLSNFPLQVSFRIILELGRYRAATRRRRPAR
jgi:phenylacetate-CoA ligase